MEVKPATGQSEIHDFSMTDSDNVDQTTAILSAKGYTYIWFVRQPNEAHTNNLDVLRGLIDKAKAAKIPFYVASSSGPDVSAPYRKEWGLMNVPFMTTDLTASKTGMRTNPGLMLLKDGVVVKKWSYLDYPKDIPAQ